MGGSHPVAGEGQAAHGLWLFLILLNRAGSARPQIPSNRRLRKCAADPVSTLFKQPAPVVGCDLKSNTTLNNGYLGSRNDEERSEMRYLV